MKLLRYKKNNFIYPGILDDNNVIRDASSLVEDWTANTLSAQKLNEINNINFSLLQKVEGKFTLAPCIGGVGKFICIGLNYFDHAKEIGMQAPSEPIIFLKATSAISGPNDDIIMPKNSQKMDWEVELGIIIGTTAKYIDKTESQNHIAGYCVINDISERDFQLKRLGQWTKGKSCDTFGPIGPYCVTKDEIKNPQNLNIWLDLNGKRMQNESTATMIFGVNYLVSYLSQFMSLYPGDIISTGTPSGVGMSFDPKIFLKRGDILELGIEGLGRQKQKII